PGRLHGGGAEEVLPPRARPGGAPARRLLHQVRGGSKERRRHHSRAALQLRSRKQGRRLPRRAQGEGHASLGERSARQARQGAALRSAFLGGASGQGRQRFPRVLEPELAGGSRRRRARAEPGGRGARGSLSVRAPRILLCGPEGLVAAGARVPPRGGAAGLVGEDPGSELSGKQCEHPPSTCCCSCRRLWGRRRWAARTTSSCVGGPRATTPSCTM